MVSSYTSHGILTLGTGALYCTRVWLFPLHIPPLACVYWAWECLHHHSATFCVEKSALTWHDGVHDCFYIVVFFLVIVLGMVTHGPPTCCTDLSVMQCSNYSSRTNHILTVKCACARYGSPSDRMPSECTTCWALRWMDMGIPQQQKAMWAFTPVSHEQESWATGSTVHLNWTVKDWKNLLALMNHDFSCDVQMVVQFGFNSMHSLTQAALCQHFRLVGVWEFLFFFIFGIHCMPPSVVWMTLSTYIPLATDLPILSILWRPGCSGSEGITVVYLMFNSLKIQAFSFYAQTNNVSELLISPDLE